MLAPPPPPHIIDRIARVKMTVLWLAATTALSWRNDSIAGDVMVAVIYDLPYSF